MESQSKLRAELSRFMPLIVAGACVVGVGLFVLLHGGGTNYDTQGQEPVHQLVRDTQTTQTAEPVCMVLENGNEVCGAKAATWCRLTDSQRKLYLADPDVSAPTRHTLQTAQRDCAIIEFDYPE